ncbi:MAG: FAD-binding protein [Myxococcota bacterium]|nr:FAD-binding protein [Myxococcota bacterium]
MRADVDRCVAAIARALPDDRVITDRDVCAAHARDESEAEGAMPDAVVRARDARDVAVVLREASAHGVPVTPRGGGTGRTGGAVPVHGGIVIASDRMREVIAIERVDGIAIVEPGLITGELHGVLEREGLFWGPDPNSWDACTIGGNVAENAGGPRSFKHGVTRDWVLGLEIVTGDGTILELGRRTKKGVTGYDLTSLLVGSEGTLGFVTRAVLRVTPSPEKVITVMAFLDREAAIAPAIAAALDARVTPRCIELLDDATLAVLRADPGSAAIAIPEAARALLVIELEGGAESLDRDLARLGDALATVSPFDPLVAVEAGERERFWRVRREMSRALRRSARSKLSEDVVVPRSRIAELIATCRAIAEQRGIRMPAYGHAGDGNLHVNLLWDRDEQEANVHAAIRDLFEATIALGGTLSGEHGIGVLKAPYLSIEQSPELIALQRRVKSQFDPRGVLNPGKIFVADPPHRGC